MNIKINDFHPLSHKKRMEIVLEYIKMNEVSTLDNNGWLGSINVENNIPITEGKYPIVIKVGNSNYHLI